MPQIRRRLNFHGLKKPKIRQDWNKFNLYNLARQRFPNVAKKTYFQQKWMAKATSRAYHGEQIREQQWTRMFDKRIPAVVPMDPKYLADQDGWRESAGRGSGLELGPTGRNQPEPLPYMQMVYFPTERRLDTAIFRALFASSARQARQHVTHGHVKVNGKKMLFPGYLLNPGDMFQVDPERVMFATGLKKKNRAMKQALLDAGYIPKLNQPLELRKNLKTAVEDHEQSVAEQEEFDEEVIEEEEEDENDELEVDNEENLAEEAALAVKQIKSTLKDLRVRTKAILAEPPKKLSGKQKQTLRAFTRTLRSHISRASSTTQTTVDALVTEFNSLESSVQGASSTAPDSPTDSTPTDADANADAAEEALSQAIRKMGENPLDPSKPYQTPWQPRPYMSAFAFIPRYLEVNQNICSAVYLRDPVVRPGRAEVPTPFPETIGQLAFNWYLRRR